MEQEQLEVVQQVAEQVLAQETIQKKVFK